MFQNPAAVLKDLEYDCNVHMMMVNLYVNDLPKNSEKQRIMKWTKKLSVSTRDEDEMIMRNDFLYNLVMQLQKGELTTPFDKDPPCEPLAELAKLLPGGLDPRVDDQFIDISSYSGEKKTRRPTVALPDGGTFLLPQNSVPTCGAYCYLQVVNRHD